LEGQRESAWSFHVTSQSIGQARSWTDPGCSRPGRARFRCPLRFGRTSGATQVDGDIDFNGAVNADDLTVFANNFNKGIGNPLAAASVQAVPEPGTIVLTVFAVIAIGVAAARRNS
jgi:hypothetical protein